MSEKVAGYLAAGAHGVWLVREEGALEIFAASGACTSSAIVQGLVLPQLR
jgi:hypothetical protein